MAFGHYRHLALIMAAGIAVRLIASELRDKHQDPGVVVVDDAGSFSVSLLSGHEGGANELARKVASLIGAQPVVTTASELSETVIYPPRSLVLGIGCHRGTRADEIEQAAFQLLLDCLLDYGVVNHDEAADVVCVLLDDLFPEIKYVHASPPSLLSEYLTEARELREDLCVSQLLKTTRKQSLF